MKSVQDKETETQAEPATPLSAYRPSRKRDVFHNKDQETRKRERKPKPGPVREII